MHRRLLRRYEIDGQDVREAILMWLRSKDMPVPQYIGTTPNCKYVHGEDGCVSIEWTEEGPVDLP